MVDTTYSFDKAAVDLIIEKLSDVKVIRIGEDGELYLDCRHLGYNENGVYVDVNDSGVPFRITARESRTPFHEFSWWQRRRLQKFFSAKREVYNRAAKLSLMNYYRQSSVTGLNTMLADMVRGK